MFDELLKITFLNLRNTSLSSSSNHPSTKTIQHHHQCTLPNGELFKKIVSALSDLAEQGNCQVDSNMISFQGMDSSHASLANLQLLECGFEGYRCDEDQCLGIQFSSLNKILKCMTSKDALSIQARDNGDIINFNEYVMDYMSAEQQLLYFYDIPECESCTHGIVNNWDDMVCNVSFYLHQTTQFRTREHYIGKSMASYILQ
ncbi:MAG: hypothetical protein GY740_00175 [Gammaproteobacteria bacterium]|nr:hypothetical protein [Gammaproteobacteria bacterium]